MARKRRSKTKKYTRRTVSRSNRRLPSKKYYQTDIFEFLPSSSPITQQTNYTQKKRASYVRKTRNIPSTLHSNSYIASPLNNSIIQSIFNAPTVVFKQLKQVKTCINRSIRKEIMHASGKAGKRGQKKPRFNDSSNIKC